MRGFRFPLVTLKGGVLEETSKNDTSYDSGIAGRIKALILSSRGTRAYGAEYGIGMEAVFSLLSGNSSEFKRNIIDTINMYIPEVNLKESDIDITSKEGIAQISITYSERDIDMNVYFQLY